MARCNTPQCLALGQKIKDLEKQYEDLISGRKARVLVDQNGERIEFNAGDRLALSRYIAVIKAEFSRECGSAREAISRPIRPFF